MGNMTRRANRPFVPQHHQDYYSLQRQVQDMEQPMETPRRPMGEVTSVEQLPLPKRTAKSSTSETATPSSNQHKSTLPIKLPFDPSFLDRAWEKSPANLN